MSLNTRTIAKLLREHFIGETPLVKEESQQKTFISSLKLKLKNIKGVETSYYHSNLDNDPDKLCYFSVHGDEEFRYYWHDSFIVKFNPDNILIIERHYDHDNSVKVYQVEQIDSFIEELKDRYDKQKMLRLKKQKINTLKQQAIIAKVKEFAKEDQFDFRTQGYGTKLKLMIRIEERQVVEIDVPYKEFQEVLKEVRSIVQSIRELQKSGLTFRLKSNSGGHRGWITHDTL